MQKEYVFNVINASEPYLKDFGEFAWTKLKFEEFFKEKKEEDICVDD